MISSGYRLLAPALAIVFSLITVPSSAAPLSPESVSRKPDVLDAKLSPDGKSVALRTTVDGHVTLAVMDVDSGKIKELTEYSDAGVASYQWLDNKRLVYSLLYLFEDRDARWTGFSDDGLFIVNRDGSGAKGVVGTLQSQFASNYQIIFQAWPIGILEDKPDWLLCIERTSEQNDHIPIVINLTTGRQRELPLDVPGELHEFWVDHANVLRLAMTSADMAHENLWYRDGVSSPWRKLATLDSLSPEFSPVDFDSDNKTLIVRTDKNGDKSALYKYDFEKNAVGEQFFTAPEANDGGDLEFTRDTHRLLGVRYEGDVPAVHWFDARRAAIQASIDKALPDNINVVTGEDHSAGLLIHSYSDRNPGVYYYYDLGTNKLKKLFAARSWINTEDLSQQNVFHYAARDGLDIPAYLTLPKNKPVKKLPLIVLAHGGPWDRDRWGFEPDVQFLASRGYAVLQPQFRGSTGYGFKLFSEGWGQWGLSMQDDITDGVQNLVKQGVVDPARVCIMGGSYGGYAAMMGLAKDPDQYRCAINLFGVTDIKLQLKLSDWDEFPEEYKKYTSKVMLGDPSKDGDKFDAVSPLKLAARIKAPVLMAYGDKDKRVPMEEGERMRDALLAQGKTVEWMAMEGEGHGFLQEASNVRFYTALDAFLRKYNPAD